MPTRAEVRRLIFLGDIDGDQLTPTEPEYLLPNDEVCPTVSSRLGYRLTSSPFRKNKIV